MHKLLIEALLEDIFSDLVKKFPTQEAQLKQAKNEGVLPKYLPWLAKILVSGSSEPIEDIIPVIKAFHQKQPALKAKFPDEPSVADINYYKSVTDLSDKLESLVSIKYQSAPSDSDILFQDKKWLIAMPRTTASSCELGKGTSWCTARTESQNLFLSYVGRNQNIFLFYVIDKEGNPRSNPDAKLSIGFINGKPVFQGQYGGITVNANNAAVTQKHFEDIVGKDNADKFLALMTSKIKSYDGKHPAQKEVDTLASDPLLLKKKLDGFVNEEERIDFAKLILDSKSISPEALLVILELDNQRLNEIIAQNPNSTPDILRKLHDHQNHYIKKDVASNPNCPVDILEQLSDSAFYTVRVAVASNPNCPVNILTKLSNDLHPHVQFAVAENPNLPTDMFVMLSNSKFSEIQEAVAKNLNCPPEILEKLSNSKNYRIKEAVAANPNCPPHILEKFSDYESSFMKFAVAFNRSCPPHILEKLSNDEHYEIRKAVAENLNTPPDILLKLGTDRNYPVKWAAQDNPNYPKPITESRFKAYIATFFNI